LAGEMKAFLAAIFGLMVGFSIGFYIARVGVPFPFRSLPDGTISDDHLIGGPRGDQLAGKDGNDIIEGGEGDDILYGGNGNDQLHGDGGFDILIGEVGSDRLWGGPGADWFASKGTGALEGGDRIEDFENGVDLIVLEKLGVTSYGAGGNTGTVFAKDSPTGDVLIDVVTSEGARFTITVGDPREAIDATQFTATDFIFE
jgi:Ca2+-binding RTX toxin-like protein